MNWLKARDLTGKFNHDDSKEERRDIVILTDVHEHKENARILKKILFIVLALFVCVVLSLYAANYINGVFEKSMPASWNVIKLAKKLFVNKNMMLIFVSMIVLFLMGIYVLFSDNQPYKSDRIQITDNIETPVAAGQGQYGSAKWMPKSRYGKVFASYSLEEGALSKFKRKNLDDIKSELERIEKLEGKVNDENEKN